MTGGTSAACVVLILVVWGAGDKDEEALGAGATVSNIADNPGAYIGKNVTVSGEITDIQGPRAFIIGGDEFLDRDRLLVIGRDPFPTIPDRTTNPYLITEDIVQVTGVIRPMVVTEIEREFDLDLKPEIEVEFTGKPVLIASSMTVTPRGDNGGASGASAEPIRDVVIIANAPDVRSLIGKRVELTGVQVRSVVGDRTFWIGPGHLRQMLVVLQEQATPSTPTEGRYDINAGQVLNIIGVIKEFPDVEEARKWDLNIGDAETLKEVEIYLQADRVEIIKRND